MLELDMDIEADLGIDSIKRVEILGAVLEAFPNLPKPDPEQAVEVRTLGHIVGMLANMMAAGSAGVAVAEPVKEPVTVTVQSTPVVSSEATPAAPPTPPAPAAVAPVPTVSAPVVSAPTAAAIASPELNQKLIDIVSEKTGYPTDMLELDMDMEADLGIDSIKRVEIFGALQESFPELPKPNPEIIGEIRTLGDIANTVAALLAEANPASAPAPAVPAGLDGLNQSLNDLGNQINQGLNGLMGDINSGLANLFNPGQSPEQTPEKSAEPIAEPATAAPVANEADRQAIADQLIQVVSDKTGYPTDMLELDMDMEADLGIDSIKRVEILGALIEQFPDLSRPDPESIGEIRTLADVLDLIQQLQAPTQKKTL
jgi:acyl carrier protein